MKENSEIHKKNIIKGKIKEQYNILIGLKYSEDNIAELYSIINNLIINLKSIDKNRKTNKCLHYLLLTKEREFERFKKAHKTEWKDCFDGAKRNLISDLKILCFK
jgi:hypothetical protein